MALESIIVRSKRYGTIRRDFLDHVIVFHDPSLRRYLLAFVDYYHRSRTHLGLQKETPEARAIQAQRRAGSSRSPEIGGLHHRYERRAA
jgi:putative transposase